MVQLPGLVDKDAVSDFSLVLIPIARFEQFQKRSVPKIFPAEAIHRFHAVVAIEYPHVFRIQDENRVGDVAEDRLVALFRCLEFFLQLAAQRDIQAHLHGGHHVSVFVANGRRAGQPADGPAIAVVSRFLESVGPAVLKGLFDRAVIAFFCAPL
jgi:hypothetical protein